MTDGTVQFKTIKIATTDDVTSLQEQAIQHGSINFSKTFTVGAFSYVEIDTGFAVDKWDNYIFIPRFVGGGDMALTNFFLGNNGNLRIWVQNCTSVSFTRTDALFLIWWIKFNY